MTQLVVRSVLAPHAIFNASSRLDLIWHPPKEEVSQSFSALHRLKLAKAQSIGSNICRTTPTSIGLKGHRERGASAQLFITLAMATSVDRICQTQVGGKTMAGERGHPTAIEDNERYCLRTRKKRRRSHKLRINGDERAPCFIRGADFDSKILRTNGRRKKKKKKNEMGGRTYVYSPHECDKNLHLHRKSQ